VCHWQRQPVNREMNRGSLRNNVIYFIVAIHTYFSHFWRTWLSLSTGTCLSKPLNKIIAAARFQVLSPFLCQMYNFGISGKEDINGKDDRCLNICNLFLKVALLNTCWFMLPNNEFIKILLNVWSVIISVIKYATVPNVYICFWNALFWYAMSYTPWFALLRRFNSNNCVEKSE